MLVPYLFIFHFVIYLFLLFNITLEDTCTFKKKLLTIHIFVLQLWIVYW